MKAQPEEGIESFQQNTLLLSLLNLRIPFVPRECPRKVLWRDIRGWNNDDFSKNFSLRLSFKPEHRELFIFFSLFFFFFELKLSCAVTKISREGFYICFQFPLSPPSFWGWFSFFLHSLTAIAHPLDGVLICGDELKLSSSRTFILDSRGFAQFFVLCYVSS